MQISAVNYSKVRNDSECIRIDAEFFKKEYLAIDAHLRKQLHKDLKDFGVKIYHPNEIKRNYIDSGGVLFLRAQNVRPLEIDLEANRVYVSNEDAKKLSKNQIKYGDVLITRTGANFGQCAIYLEKERAIASSHTFIVRTQELNPFFLCVFLNTKYGRKLIDKGMYGASQPEIAPFYLYRIPVPILSDNFYSLIESIHKKSFDFIARSRNLYSQASQILLSELNLSNWKPKHRFWFVKNYSDTKSAGRCDAEYFQTMYEEIINRSRGKVKIFLADDVFSFRRGDFIDTKYYSTEKTKRAYIRIKELSNTGSINEAKVVYISDSFGEGSQNTLREFDIVMAIIGDTIGKSNLILKEYEGSYFSNNTGRFRLRSDFKTEFDSFYLETLFHSIYIQSQIQRAKAQTGQPKIADNEIKKILIPCIDLAKQNKIGKNIRDALSKNRLSNNLLHIAKRGVEMAIEKDENTARKWIYGEVKKKLGIKLDDKKL